MKVNLTEKEEKNEQDFFSKQMSPISAKLNTLLREKELSELTPEEIDSLNIDDLEYLRGKYQVQHPKPTIIGKKPYDPFLTGITDDTWMSTGDKFKEE